LSQFDYDVKHLKAGAIQSEQLWENCAEILPVPGLSGTPNVRAVKQALTINAHHQGVHPCRSAQTII
jgi:hypothetical protein